MMNAACIVDRVGRGVQAALETNQLFLGVEQYEFENADIHPEYVTTVKIAENLTGPEVVVSLEAKMKMLRHHAARIVRLRNCGPGSKWERGSQLIERLEGYKFGKRDGQRLDILVRTNDPLAPPALVAEAKLGARNLVGVVTDIDRVFRLLRMFWDVEVLDGHRMYGAVVFHSMLEGSDMNALTRRSSNLLDAIRAHLRELSDVHEWLRHEAGLIRSFEVEEPVYGYWEFYGDGLFEDVFGKDKFAFAPGLVLLGNADDITPAAFG